MTNGYDVINNTEITRYEHDKIRIREMVEQFGNSLVQVLNPFQDIEKYRKAKKQLEESKEKLEEIAKKDSRGLEEISCNYHEDALNLLGYSLKALYIFRNSESSRELDLSVWLTKILKVPNFRYVDKVLENTPTEDLQKELEDQIEDKELSVEEMDFLLNKYNLKQPTLSG